MSALVDIEGALKTWLKANAVVSPLVGGRVFLGMPRGGPSSWPVIVLYRVGGGPVSSADYPNDEATVQFDVWGDIGGKVACFAVTSALISTLHGLVCGTMLDNEVRVLGAYGFSAVWLPDPETGRSRYAVTCVISAQST